MAESGDSVSGRKSDVDRRDEIMDLSSLHLGSEDAEPVLCREHVQECKHFCKIHMTELCSTCRRMEHKKCKRVVDIKEASEDIFSKIHGEKIIQSVKNLIERFNDCKAAAENLKSKFPNKRELAVDKVKQARKYIDDYLDELESTAVAEIDQNIKKDKKAIDEKIDVCDASLSSLNRSNIDYDRTMSVGDKEEKFIAINRATKQTKQYCAILLEMYREMSEMNVKFEPNVEFLEFPDVFQSLGTVSVETSRVTDVFTDTTPIYTGEIKVKDVGDTVVKAFDILKDGRKLVLLNNGRIQLYDENNAFITETIIPVDEEEECLPVDKEEECLPVDEEEECLSLLIYNSSENAVVTTNFGRLFKVMIGDKLVARETKPNRNIYIVTKYDELVLGEVYESGQFQICVLDKTMKTIIKTILKNDRTLFPNLEWIGVSADNNTIYVLDGNKGCYGITLDGQIVFHYQTPEAESYYGLIVDSDGLFIGSGVGSKYQVEKLNFSGEREEVFTIFGNSYPLNLVENQLVLFQYDDDNVRFCCLLK